MKDILFQYRSSLKLLLDVVVWVSVTFIAYMLRLDGSVSGFEMQILAVGGSLALVKTAAVYFFGSYRQSWRNTSFADLFLLLKMVGVITVPYLALVLALRGEYGIPLSIPVIEFLLAVPALAAMRASARFLIKYRSPAVQRNLKKKRILIAGAAVISDIPGGKTAVGVPAKVVGGRWGARSGSHSLTILSVEPACLRRGRQVLSFKWGELQTPNSIRSEAKNREALLAQAPPAGGDSPKHLSNASEHLKASRPLTLEL